MTLGGKYFAGLLALAVLLGSRAYAEPYLGVRDNGESRGPLASLTSANRGGRDIQRRLCR